MIVNVLGDDALSGEVLVTQFTKVPLELLIVSIGYVKSEIFFSCINF